MKRYLFFSGLVLALLFAFSCRKDADACQNCIQTGETECEDIQNVKKFFAFKVGSWWLYEEENSGARDSVYVTQYANDPSNYNFDVRMYSTYQDYFYHYWPVFASGAQNCDESGLTCSSCIRIKRSKYRVGEYIGADRCFIFTFWVGLDSPTTALNVNQSNNRILVESINESYSIGSNNFERTIKINELYTIIENQQPTNHYFSEDVGLIRKELLDSNQVWNLIDYYIQE